MRIFKFSIFFMLICFEHSLIAQGQITSAKYELAKNECELAAVYVEKLVSEAIKSSQRVFVISNLGKSENYKLNTVRLKGALSKLTSMGIKEEQIVTAVGERASTSAGKVNFYVGGNLFLVIAAEKGKNICLTDGDIDPKALRNTKIKK
jgi:hypothetical protein